MQLSQLSLAITALRQHALTIGQLLPEGSNRVGAIYTDPAKPSYDECIAKNVAAIAAGRPQDCVLFADAAGQTPVVYPIGAGQGKGLLLDRSAGLVRGVALLEESITLNGATQNPDGSFSIPVGTVLRFTYLDAALVDGMSYEIRFGVSAVDGSNGVAVDWCDVYGPNLTPVPGLEVFRILSRQSYDATYRFLDIECFGDSGSVTITPPSVRELPGHHQQQPTAAARGEFSRRYNLLDKTDGMTDALWQGNTRTVASSPVAAPNGTMTAFRVTPTANGGDIRQFRTVIAAGHTFVFWARKDGADSGCNAFLIDGAGAVATTLPFTLTNTWTMHTLSGSLAAGVNGRVQIGGSGLPLSGDAFDVWCPDLRLTADAIPSLPAYQRVTTASDYDETGFTTYWRAQTDDWAKSHMNPNGATKAYVFWAGQKMLGGASTQIIMEHSPSVGTNTGVVGLNAQVTDRYRFESRGVGAAIPADGPVQTVASRSALVGHGHITTDVCSVTSNGTTTTNTSDQGTGTYTEQDVFFGARAGTSLFANIREYAPPTILFLQPTDSLTNTHLIQLQKGYARSVGVTL